MKKRILLFQFIGIFLLISCSSKTARPTDQNDSGGEKAAQAKSTLDSLYKYYGIENSNLLRENYPFDDKDKATYLASSEQAEQANQYSYLWPFSGTFSAINALYEATKDESVFNILNAKTLVGLEEYFDNKRSPAAYASYINTAPQSDRFYDDNVWLGIDFTDVYEMTGKQEYLDKARLIWKFIESGTDDKLGGGIYWCEQKKESKNTCSNAPGAVYALKLFEATKDSSYFEQGKKLYEWTKKTLQDPADYLYFDNMNLQGKIGKAKYAYNSGQMMQAASLLFKLTADSLYLQDAQNIAKSSYNEFFFDFSPKEEAPFRLLKKGNIWFTAVMLRGFIELYKLDNDATYINSFRKSLDYAWAHSRDERGLFNVDWSGEEKDDKKWLLTQAAMVEMYARIASLDNK